MSTDVDFLFGGIGKQENTGASGVFSSYAYRVFSGYGGIGRTVHEDVGQKSFLG